MRYINRLLLTYLQYLITSYRIFTMSSCLDVCPVPTSAFFYSLHTNTERILMKFVGGNHYQQQINWLHFGRNCTKDEGAGYERKFKSM